MFCLLKFVSPVVCDHYQMVCQSSMSGLVPSLAVANTIALSFLSPAAKVLQRITASWMHILNCTVCEPAAEFLKK